MVTKRMITLQWRGSLKRDGKHKLFTNSGSELPSSQPLPAIMYKNREMLVNQIFVLLEIAVAVSSKEVLVESDCNASIWAWG